MFKNTRASELTKCGVPYGFVASHSWISLSGWVTCLSYFLGKIYLAYELPVHQAGIIHCIIAQMQRNLFISSGWMANFSSVEFMSSQKCHSFIISIIIICSALFWNVFITCTSILGSVAYEKLCAALTQNSLVRGIKQASPFTQVSCLEGFHSLLNQFAPKMIGYSYVGLYCRCVF